MKSLIEFYRDHQGKGSDKWDIFLREYDRLFSPYRDRPVQLLEIGIQNGGSLEIWSKYFQNGEKFVGCDINPDCAKLVFDDPRIAVVVGDANNDEIRATVLQQAFSFDLIIDDGSHTSGDIVKSFARYFSRLKDGGLFVVEDMHCSYWHAFDGGLYYPYSSMSFFKRLADVINHEHWGVSKNREQILSGIAKHFSVEFSDEILSAIHSIEFVNSMCIVRKLPNDLNVLGARVFSGFEEQVVVGLRQWVEDHQPTVDESGNFWSTLDQSPDESYERLTKQLILTEERLATLQRRMNDLLMSRSWRITRPFRSLGNVFASIYTRFFH